MRQTELVRASQCGSDREKGVTGVKWGDYGLSLFPLSISLYTGGFVLGPGRALAPCGCSCLVVIRSSHCTTAPSHYKEGQWDALCPSLSPSSSFCFCLSLCFPVLSSEKCQWSGQRQRQTGIHPCLLMLNINNITQSCLVAVVAEKGKHTYKTDVGRYSSAQTYMACLMSVWKGHSIWHVKGSDNEKSMHQSTSLQLDLMNPFTPAQNIICTVSSVK